MPTNKKNRAKTSATALQPSATQPVSRLVQAEAATMDRWLRQTAVDRSHCPIQDRLKALLWSWPIRLGFRTRDPNPLWKPREDDAETRQRKAAIHARLARLAETWYSDMVYPETEYFSDWESDGYLHPLSSPSKLDDTDVKDIGDRLRTLPGIMVPDPGNDRRWVLALLEHGWGDGNYDQRRQYHDAVVKGLRTAVRLQVCKVGEAARDAAYQDVRIHRSLDALHRTKERAQAFRDWLQAAKTHAPFVEEHLTSSRVEFHRWVERMNKAVDFYMNSASHERSRRATAGQQARPWVDQARRDLKNLKLSELHRRDLLTAWNLIPFPRSL
jgi:hypothetical protein